MSTVHSTLLLAFGSPPPGVGNKLQMLGGWVSYIAAWAAGLAFVASGAVLCWAYFSGHGSSRAMKGLGGACIGTVVIAAAAAITNALLV
jgi:hypothetical protein